MIVKFKLFESKVEDEIEQQFGEDFITEYFDKNLAEDDAEQIISLWPQTAWDHIDDDEFVNDYIRNEINNLYINDFDDEEEFILYIEDHLTTAKEKKIIEIYNENNGEEELEYDSDMLDELSEEELKSVISEDDEEDDFVEFAVKRRYEDESAQEILENIYGKDIDGRTLYNAISNYIDDDEIIKDYNDHVDYTEKKERVLDNLCSEFDTTLQDELLEIDDDNILLLAEYYKETNNDFTDYNLQKLYIEKSAEKKPEGTAIALKFLHDNFGLDSDIEEEYKDEMWLIGIEKYNV